MPKISSSHVQTGKKDSGSTFPVTLKPYRFHGVNFSVKDGAEQAVGDCPFCGRDGKWSVAVETGLWDCKVCGASGNHLTFLRQLWEVGDKTTTDYRALATDRKLLFPETVMHWGIVRSPLTKEWLVPGYSADGKINQLYRYVRMPNGGRTLLLPAPEMPHGLMGMPQYRPEKKTIYVTEGPWDGMALWELMRTAKVGEGDSGLTVTGNEQSSILSGACVIAAPTCTVFGKSWLPLFAGKRVILLYDSDHPRTNEKTGQVIPSSGYEGMKRVAQLFATSSQPPKEVLYLCWGKGGYDPELKSGYDVRDLLTFGKDGNSKEVKDRFPALQTLLGKIIPIPANWIPAGGQGGKKGSVEIQCSPCSSWEELILTWKKAMRWTEGLDRALSVMLACITSTKAVGDQLWVKVVSPASTGKSTLAEALSVARKYVYPKDTMTGLLSGYQNDKEGSETQSAVEKIRDKTLIVKDGDTVLNEPNLGKILSQFRAFYDRAIRSQYGNKMSRNHEGINATVILLGTSSLRKLDKSELGERFLDCTIMEKIDDDQEDEVLWRVANRAEIATNFISDGKMETQHTPEMVKAMRLSGGYVEYLRENANRLLIGVSFPDEEKRMCLHLGKFVAYMRARPSDKQEEIAEREFAARLVSQMIRLAKCLAVVLGRKEVDEEVMRRVKKVAFDTARGRILDIVRHLATVDRVAGESVAGLSEMTGHTEDKDRRDLRFLKKIGVVEVFQTKTTVGMIKSRPRWRLTIRLEKLYREVTQVDKE